MKIDKLCFEHAAQFIPGRGVDISIRIEPNTEIGWTKSTIKQLNIINDSNFSGAIYFLDEIREFFREEIGNGECIEINEVNFGFLALGKKVNYLYDTSDFINFHEEKEYRGNLSRQLEIKQLNISIPSGVEDIQLKHIGYITKSIKLNIWSDCNSLSINGGQEIKINGSGHNIKEITLNELTDNTILKIDNIHNTEIKISNFSLPHEGKTIKEFSINHSDIKFLEIYGFDEEKFYIEHLSFRFSVFQKGFFKNIIFGYLYIYGSELNNTTFSDIIFPQKKGNFILKDITFKDNTYSNVNWGEYFAEGESVSYEENGEKKIKEYPISSGGLKETYRMLKYEHDNIGNKTEANKFYAKEMEYYMKSLEESGNKKDYWIAWLQKFVSDFGNDWFRAFSLYVIICIFAFIIARNYSLAFDPWNEQICNGISDCKGYFIKLLNPVPKIEEINDSFGYLIFSIIKALLVYQIAVALRRISQR